MEKQRKQSELESCRRLLKSPDFKKLIILFFLFLTLPKGFSQTLTNAMIRELRITPVKEQALVVNSDIKFEVIVPYTLPSQIDVSMPEEVENADFKTLRKIEAAGTGGNAGGTKIELWFSFSKTGFYVIPPLVVKIKNSRRQLAFMPVTIGINPKEQEPLCLIVTDSGINKNLTVTAGQTVKFRLCLQYAVQLVQFSWELPKDSLFVQGKTYEFTEIKQREKQVSDALIPVSDFEWTPLIAGEMTFPKFNIQAISYNGDKVTVKEPQLKLKVLEARENNSSMENSIFALAFEEDEYQEQESSFENLSPEAAVKLAQLRSRERHSLTGQARRQRIEFEKEAGLPYSQKEFKLLWLYLSAIVTLTLILLMIVCALKKRKNLNLLLGIMLVCLLVSFIYCGVLSGRKYGISTGGRICSIPEESASIKSQLPAGNRVQLLKQSGDWWLLRFGETEGWCKKENIEVIR